MNRKLLLLLALLAIGGIAVYWVAKGDFNWSLFFSSLSNLRPGWLAASIVLTMSTYLFRATRWQALLTPLKAIPILPLFWTSLVGFSAIYLLGRAGEVVRPIWLTRREGVPFSASVATLIVERFLDSLLLIVTFAWALMIIEVPAESAATLARLKSAGWFIAGTALAAMVMLFILRSHTDFIVRIIHSIRLPWIARMVENFARGLAFLASARSLAVVVFHSAVLWFAIALQFWLMLRGMNFEFSIAAATLIMVASAIGSIAQVPGIGGGFQVGFIMCMTTFFKVPAEQATAASLIAFVFSYVPTIATGGLYMLAQGISMKELKTTIRSPESEIV